MRNRQASVFSIPSVWLQPVHVNLSSNFLFSHLIYCQLLYHPLRHTHAVSSAGPPSLQLLCDCIAQLLASFGIPWCSVSKKSLPVIDILTSLFLCSSLIKLSAHIRAVRISTSTFCECCGGKTSLLVCIVIIRCLHIKQDVCHCCLEFVKLRCLHVTFDAGLCHLCTMS